MTDDVRTSDTVDDLDARLRRHRVVGAADVPPGSSPRNRALLEEILMSDTIHRHDTNTDPNGGGTPDGSSNVVRWQHPRSRRRFMASAAAGLVVAGGVVASSIALQAGTSSTEQVVAAAANTADNDSGTVTYEVSIVDADDLGDLDTRGIIRFDGDDFDSESMPFGPDGPTIRTISVVGVLYSDGFDGVMRAFPTDVTEPAAYRLDDVLSTLERLDDFERVGSASIDGVDVDRYRASADEGDGIDAYLAALAVVPNTTEGRTSLDIDEVSYEIWVDDDTIRRVIATADADATTIRSDATITDLGVNHDIAAPEDAALFDATALALFEAFDDVADTVLDECIPEVRDLAELTDDAFTGVVSCLAANGAPDAAEILDDLGAAGADEALGAVFGLSADN